MVDKTMGYYSDPFLKFVDWFRAHTLSSKDDYKSACVLTTIGLDGYPNSRSISLKLLEHPYLIFGTSMKSAKAAEIAKDPKVALTFWWEESRQQVRVQGIASQVNEETANFLFETRNKPAQVVSLVSDQSTNLASWEKLQREYERIFASLKDQNIDRPSEWGGFRIDPVRYEFMEFKETRLHKRQVFTKVEDNWETKMLQP